MSAPIEWPAKTRELHSHHFDSTCWNDFPIRDDDVIIATYAKSGTTWMQQITAQLIFGGREDAPVAELSPWLDLRVPPKEVKWDILGAQQHRRVIKTHLPVDALVYSPRAKYVYIGRDGRDVVWSLHNHHLTANEAWYAALNDTPGRVGPPIGLPNPDPRGYFVDWLDGDGHPFWPFWENIRSWWAIRHLPNIKFVHFNDLKHDMAREIHALAAFLEIDVPAAQWPAILDHCSFDYMKRNAEKVAPLGGALWNGGGQSFIHKGSNGRWRDVLTAEDIRRYEATALAELGPDCARWLAQGGAVA